MSPHSPRSHHTSLRGMAWNFSPVLNGFPEPHEYPGRGRPSWGPSSRRPCGWNATSLASAGFGTEELGRFPGSGWFLFLVFLSLFCLMGLLREGRKNIYYDGTFPPICVYFFFYFFWPFFYLLPPTHSQPHRKTTGEIMFRVKRVLIMLLLLQRNLQMRVDGKWQSHPTNTLFLPFFLLIFIRVGCSPNSAVDLTQLTLLSLFMAVSQSVAICIARSLSLAMVEVWRFWLNFFKA